MFERIQNLKLMFLGMNTLFYSQVEQKKITLTVFLYYYG